MTDPVEIVPFGRADVRSFRWTHAGQERVTLVARSSFAVRDDEAMRLVDPEPLRGADLVPFRDRADVLVFGDPARHGERVPLSLEDEASQLDTTARVLVDRGSPAVVPEALAVPEDADWGAYQEAPAEQQAALLRGGERLVAGPLRGRVPRTRGVVYVADAGAPRSEGDRIEMDLDALHVDLDRRVCSLVYRSVFLLDSADELDGRALHVGIEPEDEVEDEAEDEDDVRDAQVDSAAEEHAADAAGIATQRAPFAPSSGDAPGALAGRTAVFYPLDRTGGGQSALGEGPSLAPSRGEGGGTEQARDLHVSREPMTTAAAFTAGAAPERGFPAAAGGASAMSSEDQPGVRIKRSRPATVAPTPPDTSPVRRALYERFRP